MAGERSRTSESRGGKTKLGTAGCLGCMLLRGFAASEHRVLYAGTFTHIPAIPMVGNGDAIDSFLHLDGSTLFVDREESGDSVNVFLF